VPSNPFSGGYGTSLGNLFDFRTYQIGVSFSFPLRNRAAKANLSRALVSGNQIDSRKKQMVQSIISEVRNAVQAVETARQRVEAAQAAVRAAEAQLKGEEQKFAVGLSTNFFVLERQNDLSAAKGNLLRAQTDYNKARADLQRVMANNVP
jgi:HAE1 family hydrophobic/amphiphilic exporter-1